MSPLNVCLFGQFTVSTPAAAGRPAELLTPTIVVALLEEVRLPVDRPGHPQLYVAEHCRSGADGGCELHHRHATLS